METEGLNFKELEEARVTPRDGHPKGQTVEQACSEIGVTVQTWYLWQRGAITHPRKRTLAAIKRYIEVVKT